MLGGKYRLTETDGGLHEQNMFEKLNGLITVRRVALLFAVFVASYLLINGKPFGVAELKERTGGIGILDLEPGYTPERAYEILENLGPDGRSFYLRILALDFIFPLTYVLFFAGLVLLLYRKWLPGLPKLQYLALIPVGAGLADWLENIFELMMLQNYPTELYTIARAANVITLGKLSMLIFTILLVDLALLGLGWRAIRDRLVPKTADDDNRVL